MNNKCMSLILNIFINLFIFSSIKIFLYRKLFRYNISYGVSLGFLSFIIADNVKINKGASIGSFVIIYDCAKFMMNSCSKIYRFTRIMGLVKYYMGKKSIVGVNTQIISRHKDRKINNVINGGRFIIGNFVTITNKHLFDVCGNILIKEKVVIGGAYSLFYTHGFDCFGNFSYGDIYLDRFIYIGANSIILPGCKITSEVVIGAGAIVSKSIKERGVYGGNPIKKISDNPKINNRISRK